MFKPPLQAIAYIEDFSGVKLQMAIFAGANWNSQGYQEGRRHAPLIFLKDTNLFRLPDSDVILNAPRYRPSELIADGWVVD